MDMDLMPGLPNEIGFECLIRVPMEDFVSVTLVCKSWNNVLKLPEFWRQKEYLSQRHGLFFFHPLSRGRCCFLPRGDRLYNKLVDFIQNEYQKRGYAEVCTPSPTMKQAKRRGMKMRFSKAERCKGHCFIFGHRDRSYRELPVRMIEFETRGVRVQDDAHIFCRESQIKNEVEGVLKFMSYVYNILGFTFELKLSTRPEKYFGDVGIWKMAETALAKALNEFGNPWEIREGYGAFYGPRIDIIVYDATGREIKCGRLQLDFHFPVRFNLCYSALDETKETPVLIHMAILGPVKRMFRKLFEQYKGKWPFWLSPRQAIVCTVSEKSQPYALQVRDRLCGPGFIINVDLSDGTINKKVRAAQLAQYNYILVVGESEVATRQVDVRVRDNNYAPRLESIKEVLNLFKNESAAFR